MSSYTKRPLHSKLDIRFFWESAPATIKQNASHYGDDSIIGVIDFSFMSIVKGEKGDMPPVAQELGQSTTDAVSQKLLTDTVGDIANILDRDIGKLGELNTKDASSIVAAINELIEELSKINTAITNDIHSGLESLETELERTVKQTDLEFGDSYTPYYEGESHHQI